MTSALRDFTRGLFLQLHVIHALILRETRTAFGKHSLGYVWAFMGPASLVGVFAGIYKLAGRTPPAGMDTIGFLCTGFLTFNLFNGTMGKAQSAVSSNLALLFYPQVQTLDLVAARCILETVTMVIAFFIFMLLNALYTQHIPLDSALKTLSGLGLAALLGTNLGLCLSSLKMWLPTAEHFIGPVLRPLFWISGLFFAASDLPYSVREAFLWNPILHVVEMTRDGWFQTYNYHYYSYTYVGAWILGFSFIGLVSERMSRKRLGTN